MYTLVNTHLHAVDEPEQGQAKSKNANIKVKRAVTKATREAAATIHRSSVLCLVGRALFHDKALQDEEVQVRRERVDVVVALHSI
jgi:hypothetical protein